MQNEFIGGVVVETMGISKFNQSDLKTSFHLVRSKVVVCWLEAFFVHWVTTRTYVDISMNRKLLNSILQTVQKSIFVSCKEIFLIDS